MTLKQLIKEKSGRELQWLARKLGITPMTLRKKRSSGEFSEPQILYLAEILGEDIETIRMAIKKETT